MNDFSFNGALRKMLLLSDDAAIYAKENHDRFLETLARAKANQDMQRLLKQNAPREKKQTFIKNIFSHIIA